MRGESASAVLLAMLFEGEFGTRCAGIGIMGDDLPISSNPQRRQREFYRKYETLVEDHILITYHT